MCTSNPSLAPVPATQCTCCALETEVVPNLEGQRGGTLGELDVLRVVRAVPTAEVSTAKRRRL